MVERFYAPVSFTSPSVELTGSEAHHLSRVLRMQAGQRVVLFDGDGTEADAEIVRIAKNSVELQVLDCRTDDAANRPKLTLATAVPKGDRFRWLVEKVTELGVDRLMPIVTARSIVEPGEGKLIKMRQTVIAAAKQCGRSRLMEIDPPSDWSTFLQSRLNQGTLLVADPDGQPVESIGQLVSRGEVCLAIGPEGGFTDDELAAALDAGALRLKLGPNILRIETAAVAAAAIVRAQIARDK